MERVLDESHRPFSSISSMEVPILWGFVHVLIGQCRQCRAVFLNGQRVKYLYVETQEYCDHTWTPNSQQD